MGNGIEIDILPYKGRPKTPWKIDIPASIAGKRIRKFFASDVLAAEWRDDFLKKTVSVGVQKALDGDAPSVRQLMKEFLARKLPEASLRQRQTLTLNARRITEAFGALPVTSITVERVDGWLSASSWAKRTRYNVLSYLRTFLNWARIVKRALKEDPLEGYEITKPAAPIAVITPEEMRVVLHCAKRDPIIFAFVVLGGFAGLRTDEVMELRWENLDWEDREIHVPPAAIKNTEHTGGMRERYVTMTDALQRHLGPGKTGKIVPWSNVKAFYEHRSKVRARVEKLLKRIKSPHAERWKDWPDNCLRHSYASARLAIVKDAWRVAHEIGHNNTKTIFSNYARAMKERAARAYFDL